MSIEKVAVTGGSGRIGGALLAELNEHGYRTANLDLEKPQEKVADEYRKTDLLDAGEVYGSLAASGADAVIHMGTIPAPGNHPGYVVYRSNVLSSYHVLEAATELDFEAVCLASSINVIGSIYQAEPANICYLPVDENHPLTPRDPYAVGKHALEITADGFGRLSGAPRTIGTLRYPWVATGKELRETLVKADRTFSGLEDTEDHTARDTLFSYLHIEDATAIARRCIEADFEGHETFWAVASDTTTAVPSERLVEEYYPDVDRQRSLDGYEALIDISKARDRLGWQPRKTWRSDGSP